MLAVIIHASYLVLIQKSSLDSEHGPLTAQYAIATMASPVWSTEQGIKSVNGLGLIPNISTFSFCSSDPLLCVFPSSSVRDSRHLSQVLLVCSFISMDTIKMWSYEGWKDPHITGIFISCVLIGCAMNFTTLHCTYINSAVTTSFVGVVKSIATITVGMLAFNDVAPTGLFIGGVVVNTVGSITYCVVKYYEMKKKSLYEDLEEAGKDRGLPGEPYREKPPLNGDGQAPGSGSDPGNPEERVPGGEVKQAALTGLANGDVWTGDGGVNSQVMTEKEVLEMQREHLQRETAASGQSVSDSYVGVWRSIRHLQFMKKEPLIKNMEQQSP